MTDQRPSEGLGYHHGAPYPGYDAPGRHRRNQPPPRRPSARVLTAVAVALALLTLAAVLVGCQDGDNGPTVNGVTAPDPACVTDPPLDSPWITDGLWVGYVDGQLRTLSSAQAAASSMSGLDTRGVFLCPPR